MAMAYARRLLGRCEVRAPAVAKIPGLHDHRSADTGPGNWREHCHLHLDRFHHAAPLAFPATGTACVYFFGAWSLSQGLDTRAAGTLPIFYFVFRIRF